MLQRLHNLVRHPVEIDRGAGPDAVESAYRDILERRTPPSTGHTSRCGVRNDADLSPPACAEGRLHSTAGSPLILTVSKTLVGLSGPIEGSKPQPRSPPARARPPRRSWPSTTRRPRAPRAARRAELRCPPTRHHHAVASRRRIGAGGVVAAAFALDDDRQRRTPDHAGTAHPRRQGRCGRTPTCEHGRWLFAGSDHKRKAAKWRCPTEEQARVPVDQSKPPSTPHPARQRPLAQALPRTCRR